MYRILRNSRIPLFLHRKSNHVFKVWRHNISIAHNKTVPKARVIGCLSVEWLIEAHYLRLFLRLSYVPHFTTLQKVIDRINNALLEKIILSFIVISGTKRIFVGVDVQKYALKQS